MKTFTFAIILALPFLIISCIDTNETPARTAETEQQELNQAIANLEKAGYDVDTTDLGVFYIMDKIGSGPLPQQSDTCFLIYTGFLLNGTVFDSSGDYYQDSIWQFNYLEVNLIPGFNDGIALLNKDAEAEIIVPSKLAYGATGYGAIQPFTPLVFSMKMRDLKPVQ
jgi:FKBP-type peptidyl-prolyl cis-trans isomerase FkpA